MSYSATLDRLNAYAEEKFAAFQRKLIFTKYEILGVRTPTFRKLAKEYTGSVDELLGYPNEYYEIVCLKLAVVSALPYEQFIRYLPACLSLIDNWALCDCFRAKCLKARKEDFLPILENLFQTGKEYFVRYVLVTLLFEYTDKRYLPLVKAYLRRTDCEPYYIHMAAAWLTAEILTKHYEEGVSLLKERILPPKTHNKAIQKAIESYRVTQEEKEYLRSLKIK